MKAEVPTDGPATRLATRLVFLVAGFGIACWAPLVPFAKGRLALDDGALGLILLCIGAGSVVAMLATGPLSARYGSKPIIMGSGIALGVVLPTLSIAPTPLTLGAFLLLFGGALGSLDVAVNIHAIEVERASDRPLMSGFHALFSIGGFAGAGLMTLFLSAGVTTLQATLACSALMLVAMVAARPRLLTSARAEPGPVFVKPHGIVVLLAVLAMATFLAEGAMLDWSALLVTERKLAPPAQAGIGYILFATAMTIGRLFGDAIVARLGDVRTLVIGGFIAVAGFIVLLTAGAPLALGGFFAIGVGASNIVPVLFRRAGAQASMPPALAIAAVTTLGYAGILIGPAGIGFVAKAMGLAAAFWIVAALMALVPLTANRAAGGG